MSKNLLSITDYDRNVGKILYMITDEIKFFYTDPYGSEGEGAGSHLSS
jgi:hypothetical protein